ncbi:PIN domain-containing protein [candidate division KSB1 bacterium]|nr:PIN domain-containing protein [candidate division KSB1 bacterium]
MKNNYVADTMAIILRLENRKLSQKVKNIFDESEAGQIKIFIPTMVLAEIGYLSERNKIDTTLKEVNNYCKKYPTIMPQSISDKIISKSFEIDDIPELHDRIIAGTAFYKGLELITNDRIIIASQFISTVW